MAEVGLIFPEEAAKQLTDVDKGLTAVDTTCLRLIKTTNDLSVKLKESGISLEMLSKMQKQTEDTSKNLDATAKQYIATEQKIIQVKKELSKEEIKNSVERQKRVQGIKDEIKAEGLAEGSLVRMRQKLSQLTAEYDKSGKRTKEAAKEIHNLSKEIELAENETNRFQRGVGGYKNQLGELSRGVTTGTLSLKQFGQGLMSIGKATLAFFLTPVGMIIAAMGTLYMVGKTLIKNVIDFQKAASSLSAITGAVGKDLAFMKKQAREFAKESTLSATEILGSFEKIGSALPELLKNSPLLTEVTKNAIILSESTGGKLAVEDAARAAASALSAFNIPLTESAKVVNILAAGSLAGSSEVQDLALSMKTGGAVAAASGLSLEEYVSALETVANATGGLIKAEEAGTQFKSMVLALKKEGKGFVSGNFNLKDALIQVNEEMTALKNPIERTALEAKSFGRYGITMGIILRDNIGAFDEMKKSVTGTNIAFEQARVQMDNIAGSYKKWGNAWRGLLLSVEDGGGIFARSWKWIVDQSTADLNRLSGFIDWFRSKEAKARRDEKLAAKEAKTDKETEAAVAEEMVNSLEQSLQKEILVIRQTQREKKAAQEETNALIMAKELEFYQKQLDIQKKAGLDTIQTEQKIEGVLAMLETKGGLDEIKKQKAQELANKKKEIAEKAAEDQKKIDEKAAKNYQDALDYEMDIEEKAYQWKLKKAEDAANEQAEIDQLYIEAAIADKQRQYEQELSIIDATAKNETDKREKIHALNQKTINEEMDNAFLMLQQMDLTGEEEIYWIEKLKDLKHEAALAEMEDDTKIAEEKKKKALEYMDTVQKIGSELFAFSINKTQGELTALEEKNKAGLISDQEYAKQKSALELKQAKQQRIQALFEIAINTASAIVQALPNVALAIIVGVLGAIQAATVLSTPLPKALAKGSKNAPKEFIAGEAGRELIALKSGQVMLADQATYFEGNQFKGATVFSNPETERIMSRTNHQGYGAISFSDKQIVTGLSRVEKAITKKPVAIFQDGNYIGWQNDTHKEIYLDRLRKG